MYKFLNYKPMTVILNIIKNIYMMYKLYNFQNTLTPV